MQTNSHTKIRCVNSNSQWIEYNSLFIDMIHNSSIGQSHTEDSESNSSLLHCVEEPADSPDMFHYILLDSWAEDNMGRC